MINSLFKQKRTCCVCEAQATFGARKPIQGEPNIISISPVIYMRGTGKGQLRNAPKVQICATCLTKALAGGTFGIGVQDKKLWLALGQSLSSGYSALLDADQMQMDDPTVWADLRASLPFPSAKESQG